LFRIEGHKDTNKQLVVDLKETIESTMSAEENAKRMEEFFLKAKQKEFQLNQDMKKKSELMYKVSQELYELKTGQRNLEAEIDGCESSLRNLENRINRLDHDSLKQAEIIYGQVRGKNNNLQP
jgi:chromosome segregation ATPase